MSLQFAQGLLSSAAMDPRRPILMLAPLALLGGCVAAAIPVLAGGVLVKKGGKDRDQAAAVAPSPAPQVTVLGPDTPASLATRVGAPVMAAPAVAALPVAAPAVVAPAVAAPVGGNPYAAFARYAVARTLAVPVGERRSALVDQETLTGTPALAMCEGEPFAVVVDLDPGERPFDPANPPLPAAGLAEQLAAIRGAGLTVLWAASAPVDQAQQVYTVLRAAGLDPDRTDRLLLPRNAEERKQTRRLAAARDWCVVAVAGDRKGDFDEVLDYLQDPEGPIARTLTPTFGNGWFLVPTPIE